MSTLKVSSIQNPSTSSGGVSIDTSGNVTLPRVSSINGGQLAGFRNRIMNGYMRVDQRNATAGISTGVGTVTYGIDRWYCYASGAALTMERVDSTAPGFEKALRVLGAGGNTVLIIGQRIEANNAYALAGQQVTLSFYAATSGSLTVKWKIMIPNSANDFSGQTLGVDGTVATAGTMAKYSATFTMPAGATKGAAVEFELTGGLTTGSIDITGVQLEPGSVATPYEYRPIGTELALCQRYYFSDISGRPYQFGFGNSSTGWMSGTAGLPQSMRAIPAVVLYGDSGANSVGFLGPDGLNLVVASGTSFRLGSAANSTKTIPVQARSSTTGVRGFWFGLTADAEL
jgi:hypothetical protein